MEGERERDRRDRQPTGKGVIERAEAASLLIVRACRNRNSIMLLFICLTAV